MTNEQIETLKKLIETNQAGATAYLEAITDRHGNEQESTIKQALAKVAESKNQLKK